MKRHIQCKTGDIVLLDSTNSSGKEIYVLVAECSEKWVHFVHARHTITPLQTEKCASWYINLMFIENVTLRLQRQQYEKIVQTAVLKWVVSKTEEYIGLVANSHQLNLQK
jgi:hypothetical protein